MYKLTLLIISGLFASQFAQADGRGVIKIKLDTSGTYKAVSATELQGLENRLVMTISTQVISTDGTTHEESFGPMEVTEPATDSLTLSKDTVTSNDLKTGTLRFAAQINNESIRISKEEYLRVSQATLQKQGDSLISKLQLLSDNAKASFEMKVSDLTCQRAEITTCEASIEFLIEGEN